MPELRPGTRSTAAQIAKDICSSGSFSTLELPESLSALPYHEIYTVSII
jgi:hypothetical protein